MKLKDIEKLHRDGFLTDAQRDEAISRYRLDTRGMSRWLIYSLSVLAAGLLVGGSVVLARAHWEEFTPMMKMCGGMGLLAAAWMAYFVLRRSVPMVAEALAVVGAGAWLACILLLESLFHTGTPEVECCFVFFAGIVLIPFLTRQRLLIGVVALTSIVLYIMTLTSNNSFLSLHWLYNSHELTMTLGAYLLLLFWWLLAERAHGSRGLMRGYSWVGVPIFIAFLIIVHLPLLHKGITIKNAHPLIYDRVLYAVAPLLFLLFKPRRVRWGGWLLLMVSTALLLPAIAFSLQHHHVVCGLGVCTAYALILMFTGVHCGRVSWINYGSLLIILTFIGLVGGILRSQENTGLVLLISGAGMLALTLLLEWQRRRLVRRVKQAAAATQAQHAGTDKAPADSSQPSTEA